MLLRQIGKWGIKLCFAESVKSVLEPDFLEDTSSGLWLVSSMSGTDQMTERKRASASASPSASAESSGSSGTAEVPSICAWKMSNIILIIRFLSEKKKKIGMK